jgi:acetoin utilization deacetylase AcuC-like enzyme
LKRGLTKTTDRFFPFTLILSKGIDDTNYHLVFKPVIDKVMQSYQPEAIVLQCGADSLAADRLGAFDLTRLVTASNSLLTILTLTFVDRLF